LILNTFFLTFVYQNKQLPMNTIVPESTVITGNVRLKGHLKAGFENVLTPEALGFLAALHERFNPERLALLRQRSDQQDKINAGHFPDFPAGKQSPGNMAWKIDPVPSCLQNRRVEITGPVDRKMIINALNSGANVYMADFEDSTAPTWQNIIEGQVNLKDAVRKTISFTAPDGRSYHLNDEVAVLMVRPRGWHLEEAHILIDGEPASASLVDFALFAFHNGSLLAAQELGPFYYLPKLENHLEARLWNDVFTSTEEMLGLKAGTIKATVLIETITAAFEMEEILYELRTHGAGLNAGRWDYIFSIIKKFHRHPPFIMPDRSQVTMNVPFMKAYARQLVTVCHKRGAHAIGGMSAFIPVKDETVNAKAYEKVRTDKEREALLGYDGTWVAHPGLVAVAREIFDRMLGAEPHQKHVMPGHSSATAAELLDVPSAKGTITAQGLYTNVNVALLYLESWLNGVGAAALYNQMEDAATAEISRAQLWQWVHHQAILEDNRRITAARYQEICDEVYEKISEEFSAAGKDISRLQTARLILDRLVLSETFEDFLTIKAYPYIQ
jgi:malate synthase